MPSISNGPCNSTRCWIGSPVTEVSPLAHVRGGTVGPGAATVPGQDRADHATRRLAAAVTTLCRRTSTHFSWNVGREFKVGMIPEAREVRLSRKDRKVLEACCRSPLTLQRDLKRARIVLLAADGRSTRSITKEVDVKPRIVSLWRVAMPNKALKGCKTSRGPASSRSKRRRSISGF